MRPGETTPINTPLIFTTLDGMADFTIHIVGVGVLHITIVGMTHFLSIRSGVLDTMAHTGVLLMATAHGAAA